MVIVRRPELVAGGTVVNERWRPLDVADVDPDPFTQFAAWWSEGSPEMFEPQSVVLATADDQGQPHARYVLLRHVDTTSFGFYTNYDSQKGRDLHVNPRAALLWYCEPLGRQIRIEGDVTPMSEQESDEYFSSRPRGHQIGAWASAQSQPLSSRAELEARTEEFAHRFADRPIERPERWGGYRLVPARFEFWQHRQDRLHDRVVYVRDRDEWRTQRLSP